MTIIEAMRRFLEDYPGFDGGKLNVDFLPPTAAGYSVDVVPVQSVIRRYMDGSTARQFCFVVAMRSAWGADVRCQMDNLGFFESLGDWLERQSRARNFPELGEGRVGRKLEVTASGYAFAPGADLARYQMQCKLTYYQKNIDE